jgi:hypothetical protein
MFRILPQVSANAAKPMTSSASYPGLVPRIHQSSQKAFFAKDGLPGHGLQ